MADQPSVICSTRLRPVLDWLLSEGRLEQNLSRFIDGLMSRSVTAGLPIWRFYIGLQLVHPQMVATGVLWRRGEGSEQVPRLHGILKERICRQRSFAISCSHCHTILSPPSATIFTIAVPAAGQEHLRAQAGWSELQKENFYGSGNNAAAPR